MERASRLIHLVAAVRSGLESPHELHQAYPQLTMSQICSALAYYYDHQAEMDSHINTEAALASAERFAEPVSPGQIKLREMGLLP